MHTYLFCGLITVGSILGILAALGLFECIRYMIHFITGSEEEFEWHWIWEKIFFNPATRQFDVENREDAALAVFVTVTVGILIWPLYILFVIFLAIMFGGRAIYNLKEK